MCSDQEQLQSTVWRQLLWTHSIWMLPWPVCRRLLWSKQYWMLGMHILTDWVLRCHNWRLSFKVPETWRNWLQGYNRRKIFIYIPRCVVSLCLRPHWKMVPEAFCIQVRPSVSECMSLCVPSRVKVTAGSPKNLGPNSQTILRQSYDNVSLTIYHKTTSEFTKQLW